MANNKDILNQLKTHFNPLKEYLKFCKFNSLKKGKKTYCGCCGKLIKDESKQHLPRECKCRKKFEATNHAKVGHNETCMSYMIGETLNGNMLLRVFNIWLEEKIGQPFKIDHCEVMRFLIDNKGHITFARRGTSQVYYSCKWKYESEMVIAKFGDKYDYTPYGFGDFKSNDYFKYFDFYISEKYRKWKNQKNYNSYIKPITFMDFIKVKIKYPVELETLFKLNRFDLIYMLKYCDSNLYEIMSLARHDIHPELKYIFDGTLSHYYDSCHRFSKDTKNPKILYPDDFENANEMLERKIAKIQDAKQLEENIKNYEESYIKSHKKWFGKDFGKNGYSIQLLKSVKEFYEEGLTMHHCVYRMAYYKKPSSLIFSVKKDNKRVETCEVVLKNREAQIAQCYGFGDKLTPNHEEIISIMESQLKQIECI